MNLLRCDGLVDAGSAFPCDGEENLRLHEFLSIGANDASIIIQQPCASQITPQSLLEDCGVVPDSGNDQESSVLKLSLGTLVTAVAEQGRVLTPGDIARIDGLLRWRYLQKHAGWRSQSQGARPASFPRLSGHRRRCRHPATARSALRSAR